MKPPDRQGQRGLSVVDDAAGLSGAIELALEASRSGACLVEELVEGPEITVNAFSADGVFHPLTVTDRLTADPPAFGVALAHAWPSSVATEACVVAARAAAEAVGIREGPTYTQLRVGPDGPRVLELAARLGGGHDAELCEVALGIDLSGLALAAALGEPAEVPVAEPVGGACVRFLVPPEGVLRRSKASVKPPRSTECWTSASTESPGGPTSPSGAVPTGPVTCSAGGSPGTTL